jgi:hypothetical protein
MKVAYGVEWRERDAEEAGRLMLGHNSIRLTGFDEDGAVRRELAFDEIVAAELRRPETKSRRTTLMLTLRDGSELEIESAADKWIVNDLLEKVFVCILDAGSGRRRTLLAVKLKPGCLDAARELLREGPPFDPAGTTLIVHDVFLLDDEALFMFEIDDRDDLEQFLDLHAWTALAAWRELTTGEVQLAEQAYSWTRNDSVPSSVTRVGLGF